MQPLHAVASQDQVAKLALEGIKPAMMYCGFQQWAVAKQEIPGEMDLKRARELQVLEIVETAGSFVRVQHPRTRQFLGYISGNKYASINRAEFGKILASLYQECKDTGLQLARAGPGTLSFDGQFSQGHCMVNLWLSNNAGRLHLGTEDFKDSKQDAACMASFALEAVERVGPEHISAIVTDGPSVMRKARRLFLRRPGTSKIRWVFCLEHAGNVVAKRLPKIFPWLRSSAKDCHGFSTLNPEVYIGTEDGESF